MRGVKFFYFGKDLSFILKEVLQAGMCEIVWNAANFAGGVNFCRLKSGNFFGEKKAALSEFAA